MRVEESWRMVRNPEESQVDDVWTVVLNNCGWKHISTPRIASSKTHQSSNTSAHDVSYAVNDQKKVEGDSRGGGGGGGGGERGGNKRRLQSIYFDVKVEVGLAIWWQSEQLARDLLLIESAGEEGGREPILKQSQKDPVHPLTNPEGSWKKLERILERILTTSLKRKEGSVRERKDLIRIGRNTRQWRCSMKRQRNLRRHKGAISMNPSRVDITWPTTSSALSRPSHQRANIDSANFYHQFKP